MKARSEGKRVAIVSGGELTVTVRGQGRGGPNQEYALALADLLQDMEGVAALAWLPQRVAGTDVLLVAVGARLVAVCAT